MALEKTASLVPWLDAVAIQMRYHCRGRDIGTGGSYQDLRNEVKF